jgi:hypothetical protein
MDTTKVCEVRDRLIWIGERWIQTGRWDRAIVYTLDEAIALQRRLEKAIKQIEEAA